MSIHPIERLSGVREKIRHAFNPKAILLQYHRIAELPLDPHQISVTPDHFWEHLDILRRYAHPIPLHELVQSIGDKHLPNRAVAITLDDGYADNLYNGKPILENYKFPATAFLVTGTIGSSQEYWWDELEGLLLHPGKLPNCLDLKINVSDFHWKLDGAASYEENEFQRQRDWNMEAQVDPGPRQRLFRALWERIRTLDDNERRMTLKELSAWAGANREARETHRILDANEIVSLASSEWIEIGAHTVSHPVLSRLSIEQQQFEIQKSKCDLEQLLGRPVKGFSYPHGQKTDYTAQTAALVQEAGFTYACSSLPGEVWPDSDRFQLPRMVVRDWDGEEFSRRLWHFLRG